MIASPRSPAAPDSSDSLVRGITAEGPWAGRFELGFVLLRLTVLRQCLAIRVHVCTLSCRARPLCVCSARVGGFLTLEGPDSDVGVLLAPVTIDVSAMASAPGQRAMYCYLWDGAVYLDGGAVRGYTPGWGVEMARGETARVVFAAATRMLNLVWRGREIDLAPAPLSAAALGEYGFGVVRGVGNAMRVVAASLRGAFRARTCAP